MKLGLVSLLVVSVLVLGISQVEAYDGDIRFDATTDITNGDIVSFEGRLANHQPEPNSVVKITFFDTDGSVLESIDIEIDSQMTLFENVAETWNFKFEIDQDKCIKCDWCLKAKPRPECILMLKELRHDEKGRVVSWDSTDYVHEMNLIWINQNECIRCGACLEACPVDAIQLQQVSLSTEPVGQEDNFRQEHMNE